MFHTKFKEIKKENFFNRIVIEWNCYQASRDQNHYVKLRLNTEGDVECGTNVDGRCYWWGTDLEACQQYTPLKSWSCAQREQLHAQCKKTFLIFCAIFLFLIL